MKSVSRNFVQRLFAGLAVVALLLAGFSVVAPAGAQAEDEGFGDILIGGLIVTGVVVTLLVLDRDDDEEHPQSP